MQKSQSACYNFYRTGSAFVQVYYLRKIDCGRRKDDHICIVSLRFRNLVKCCSQKLSYVEKNSHDEWKVLACVAFEFISQERNARDGSNLVH